MDSALRPVIGLVAGNGRFPALFCHKAQKHGFSVVCAAHENETDPAISTLADAVTWVPIGQVAAIIDFFKVHQAGRAVLLGGITKSRLLTDFSPDDLAERLLASLDTTGDDAVLRAFAAVLEESGITVAAPTGLVPELLAPSGCWTKAAPDIQQQKDLSLAFSVARAVGALDVGQCVVVERGSVLAVEAIEGTDRCLVRAGELGAQNAVAVKVKKPGQDERFDLPAAGCDTLSVMAQSGIRVLGLPAGHAVVFDREDMVRQADETGLALVGITE